MTILILAIAIAAFAFGCSFIIVGLFTRSKDITEKQVFRWTFGGFLLILVGIVGINYAAKNPKFNNIVVNTKEIPQIDTTNTYHLVSEK